MAFINFEEAVALLKKGEIIAFPTETVYGLGAIATNTEAILKIYKKKQRPFFNPLILHTANLQQALKYGKFNKLALQLAKQLWPGPMTLIVEKRCNSISPAATAGLQTLAIRIPNHPQAQKLISAVGYPLVAPSANPSGRLSATSSLHVTSLFDNTVPILDCPEISTVGLESTIIDCTQNHPVILRYGAITEDLIEKYTGLTPKTSKNTDPIKAPGMLLRHYAPKLPLYLNQKKPLENQAFITFGNPTFTELPHNTKIFPLSINENLEEAAKNLFSTLHIADNHTPKFNSIGVMPIPHKNIGKAINDRLLRGSYI